VLRWSAVTLLDAENRFNKIKGFRQLEQLEQMLEKLTADKKKSKLKTHL